MSDRFPISCFADEIDADLTKQLDCMNELEIGLMDLRHVGDKNVSKFTDGEADDIASHCTARGVAVSCIGSPVGKSALAEPIENEIANLTRCCEIARRVGTDNVRVFSFYPADTSTNAHYDQHVDECIGRMSRLADVAETMDCQLLLENERRIVTDTPDRCLRVVEGVNSPRLKLIWDPANFVGLADHLMSTWWPQLVDHVALIHVKDARIGESGAVPAGEGDGECPQLIAELTRIDFKGTLALEPHLAVAGHSGGFSGPDGMARAAGALRDLVAAGETTAG